MNVTRYSPKVSVILPIYNTEPYLIQCVSSIQNQTLSNIEIICVDDNSNDKSAELIKELSANDKRIMAVYNTQNMGAAYCRNLGIKMSKGEYLVFLDSDDYFDKEMLKKGVNALEKNGADIVFWEAFNYDNISKKICFERVLSEYFRQKLLSPFSPDEISEYILSIFPVAPWHRMYRREFIISNELWYQSLSNSNDVYFGHMSLLFAKKIIYLAERFVYRRINRSGQILETRGKNPLCVYESYLTLYNRIIKAKLFSLYKKSFYKAIITSIFYGMYATGHTKRTIKEFQEFMINQGWKNLGMNALSREDFVSDLDYIRYKMAVQDKNFEEARDCDIDILFNKELIDAIKPLGRKFCLWGFGKRGKKFFHISQQYNLEISCVVDQSYESKTSVVKGIKISSLEEQDASFDTVLITNLAFYDDVRKTLLKNGRHNVKIVDIDTSIQYQIPIGECVYV